MELPLKDRLEIRLQALTGNFNEHSKVHDTAHFHFINIRTDHFDLMILHLIQLAAADQFKTIHFRSIKVDLHIFLTDDLSFKCRGVCKRDIDICDFDLDISCFQGGLNEIFGIFLNDQRLRNTPHILGIIGDDRESQCDRAAAAGYGHISDRFKCIDERTQTDKGVFLESIPVTRLDRAKDHRRSVAE